DVILQEYGLSIDMSAEDIAKALGTDVVSQSALADLFSKDRDQLLETIVDQFDAAAEANKALMVTVVNEALARSEEQREQANRERERLEYAARVKNDALVGSANLVGAVWSLYDPVEGQKIQSILHDSMKLYKTIELYRPAIDGGGKLGALG